MRGKPNDGGGREYRRTDRYQGHHRPVGQQQTVSEVPARPGARSRRAAVRHRRATRWRVWAGDHPIRRPVLAALLLVVGFGALFVAMSSDTRREAGSKSASLAATVGVPVDRHRREVSRSEQRTAPGAEAGTGVVGSAEATASPSASASASPSPSPSPSVAPKPTLTSVAPARPAPVEGLSQVQMDYATTIVHVGEQLKLPKQAYVVAIATALQESNLLNLANYGVSESLDLAHDGVGGDHDSVGLFQQRPSSGWGTVEELMDPATAATKFYEALETIPGWESMSVTEAAQTVQNSGFPDAYAQQEAKATAIVAALV